MEKVDLVPVEFLSDEQAAVYAQFSGDLTRIRLPNASYEAAKTYIR